MPPEAERALAESPAARQSPRFVRLLIDELLVTGDFENLLDQLRTLLREGRGGVRDLCAVLVRRWERSLGAELVRDAICLLWLSRDGLSEAELQQLLARSTDLEFIQLLATLGDNIVNRSG